jgi:hypothetical protein
MASNKNQHFVPRCYLKHFTAGAANSAIHLFNIDKKRFINNAPVKNQCSRDYFYGRDLRLEKALQDIEGLYATAVSSILQPGYVLEDGERLLLLRFWLLQHLRTDAASARAAEMTTSMGSAAGLSAEEYKLGIQEAVHISLRAFAEHSDAVDDLKTCLILNRTPMPFITSDDPAIFANRWYQMKLRKFGRSFGLNAAGTILLLPLTPRVLFLAYDGDVYSVPNKDGWVDVSLERDIAAINERQYLNCRANIFVHDACHAGSVERHFNDVAHLRPASRHIVHYAVLDRREGNHSLYRVVPNRASEEHARALIHVEAVRCVPRAWPMFLRWRSRGVVYTNDTGLGYIRRAWLNRTSATGFKKEPTGYS